MTASTPMIVIADSDTVYVALMQEILEEEGYGVASTYAGRGAYALIRQVDADLLILDIPIMTPDAAWTTLNSLRLDPATKHLPVLICSTNTHRVEATAAHLSTMGCCIIPKPFDLDTMLIEIRALLNGPAASVDGVA